MPLSDRTKRLARKSREKVAGTTTWVLPLGALICVVFLQISNFSWVNWMRHRAFDAFQQLKPREYVDAGVRIIDLDDATLAKLGQWPWPRTQVAKLERRLQELGAAATVYDVFFSEADRTSPRALAAGLPPGPEFAGLKERLAKLPDNDAVLARALREGRSVLGLALTTETNAVVISTKGAVAISAAKPEHIPKLNKFPGAVANIPILDDAAGGLGNVGFSSELDQSIRKSPLFFSRAGRIVPALAVEGLRVAQGASRVGLKLAGGSGEMSDEEGGNERDVVAVKIGEITTPTERDSSLWIYYTSPEDSKRRVIPAWRLFEKGFDPAQVEGTICFIGTSATGLKDLRVTPLNPAAAGVEVHANLAEQILTGTFLAKPDWALGAEIAYLLVLGLLLLFLLERVGALYSAPVALAAVAGSLGMSWYGFTAHRFLIDPVLPLLGLFSVYTTWTAVTFVKTEDAKRRITGTFGRYLSPKVVEKLASNPGEIELGGETREMTFHFCDVRGFTTISEKFDPAGLTVFINKFLTPMTEIILAHDGTIDKYIGDCIMAF